MIEWHTELPMIALSVVPALKNARSMPLKKATRSILSIKANVLNVAPVWKCAPAMR